jgi:hypothetical protein
MPKMRRLARDIGWLTRNRYSIRGLLEVDVSRPRQIVHERKARTGEGWSFTAFLAKCAGQAVETHKSAHAMCNWRGDLVTFDEVDISLLVERTAGGQNYPLAHIVRAANR